MPDIATIKEILAKYGVPAGAAEELLSAAAKAEAKPRAVKVEQRPRPVVKEPDAPATWVQCVSLYRASKGALRFWKGEHTALTKGVASVLIEAVKRQQAEGRKVFVPALCPELKGLTLPQEEITAWAKAGFALAPAAPAKAEAPKPRAKRVKKVSGSKKAAKKQLTPAEQIAQALAALAK